MGRKGIILTYKGELYREPDEVYGENIEILKVIPRFTNNEIKAVYKDEDRELAFGDIINIKGTDEEFVFVCKSKKFSYICEITSPNDFKGFRRILTSKILKRTDVLDLSLIESLQGNLKDSLEKDRYVPEEIKPKIEGLVFKS